MQVLQLVSDVWQKEGLIKRADSPFLREAARILKNSLELVTDAGQQLRELLDYPLTESMAEDEKAQAVLEDNFTEVGSFSGAASVRTAGYPAESSCLRPLNGEELVSMDRASAEVLHILWIHGMHTLITCAHYLGLRAKETSTKRTMTHISCDPCPFTLHFLITTCERAGCAVPGGGGGGGCMGERRAAECA